FSRKLICEVEKGATIFSTEKEIGINTNIRRIPGTVHLHANFVFIKKWANMLFDCYSSCGD
ncbi:hypothetical protein, partial [Listeria monocytogenes]|uniref:hypothetical protein n=1 Tax=Listeria monocytogenes TaxID=1639 RepID=UPI001C4027AF